MGLLLFLDSELGEESKNAVRESDEKKVKYLAEEVYIVGKVYPQDRAGKK